jgi:tRNA dimethylallyltransferase
VSGSKPLLICLMGPTASGKTDLAIEIAEARSCELISVDSALVYRGLDIGSAKPDYPHHLVDIRDPAEIYSAADFAADARRLVQAIVQRDRTPLLVGGTMLYFKALLDGLAAMPAADPAIRAEIEGLAAARGWPQVHAELARVDPESAARIHPNHSRRLARALEVFRATGTPISRLHLEGPAGGMSCEATDIRARYRVVQIAVCPEDRSILHHRIEERFHRMLAAGFLEEVRGLRNRGDLGPDLPATRAVGYRQLWQYLDGETTLNEAVERGVAATRQLAKRQLTWLRKWPDLRWIYTDPAGNLSGKGLSDEEFTKAGGDPLRLALNWIDSSP